MISSPLRFVIIGLLTSSLVQAQETQGTPGVDYPNFVTIPNLSFKCSDQEFIPGFYADLETQCQAYHYCSEEGQETFLCPIGSIFNQAKLVCDAWHNFNCTLASQLYSSNSGFLLEMAMKNVPLLIKLRNRALKRLSFKVPATDVHEKITSLFENTELDQSSAEGSSVSIKVNGENPDTNEAQGKLNEDESLDDILSRLEANIQNDEPDDGIYDNGNGGASDEMQTNLFFDTVTEKYYVESESSQNEWSQDFDYDQIGLYGRENFAYKYDLAMQDAEGSRDFVESTSEPNDLYRLNEMNKVADEFLKRQMDIEQPFRRLRRRPIYTVSQDDDELPISMRDSLMDSEDVTTEFISVVTDSSQPSAETTTKTERVRSNTRAPFEMVEDLSRMHMTPLNITEVPMTSEEFEDAIISELIVPKLDEHDLRVLGSTMDQEQPNGGNADDASSDVQNDGYYRYVENESPDQFVYSSVYDASSDAENPETDSGTSDQIDDAAEYYQDERADGDSGKSETFVVIPDESEIPEFSEAFGKSESFAESTFTDLRDQNANEDADARDLMESNIPTSYKSQGVYSAADPSQYRTSRYYPSVEHGPGQYFHQGYFSSENEQSLPHSYADKYYVADDAGAKGSEYHQYGFEANDPTNQYMYAPSSYACQQQIGYADCMYGTQSGYPYAGYYNNPYVNNFPYGVFDLEESSESPVPEVDGIYSSESPMSYMIQSDPNMNNEQFKTNLDYGHTNSYQDRNLDATDYPKEYPDNSATILENESVDQDIYYVLDDDETTAEVNPESVSTQPSLDNIHGIRDVTGSQDETYYILNDEDEEKVTEGDPEVKTFADISGNKVNEQQAFSQDKSIHFEESSQEDSTDGMPPQTAGFKDVSQSEETSALGDGAESVFGSTMDSRFTHGTNGGSFRTKSNRNGEVLLDPSKQLSRHDETSKVLVSNHGNLPNLFSNNMAYSDPLNFGPHGFGSTFGKPMVGGSRTEFSFANGRKRTGDSASPNVSKLSALQERIRSLKQGKFGAFKKYVSASGSKN